MHGRIQDGRGGPRQPEAGDDQGGEEERERHRPLLPQEILMNFFLIMTKI